MVLRSEESQGDSSDLVAGSESIVASGEYSATDVLRVGDAATNAQDETVVDVVHPYSETTVLQVVDGMNDEIAVLADTCLLLSERKGGKVADVRSRARDWLRAMLRVTGIAPTKGGDIALSDAKPA